MLADLIILIQDIAHNLLQDILHGHQPVCLPVFIHNHNHLLLSGLHLPEQLINIPGPRNKYRLPHQPFQVPERPAVIACVRMVTQGIFQMQDTDDMVNILLIDRIAAVISLHHKGDGILQRHIRVNGHYALPVGHDILSFLVSELEDVGNHLRLAGLDDSLLMAFVHHIDDLFFRHVRLTGIPVYAEYPQNPLGGNPDQPCKGHQHLHQKIDWRDAQIRPFLRRSGCNRLRKQDSYRKRYV